jgi:hypothetical protein
MAFKRRRTSSCCVVCQWPDIEGADDAPKKRALVVSHLELVDEHSNRVELVALILALHGVFESLVVVRPVKEWMAVVQDSRRWSCSRSRCGREATLRGLLALRLLVKEDLSHATCLAMSSYGSVMQRSVEGAAGIG